MTQFRARGIYREMNRKSWVTTGWRNTAEEAEFDVRCYGDEIRYSKVWIVTDENRYTGQSPTI